MCRICGRAVKCIFDSMPSRLPIATIRSFSTGIRIKPAKDGLRRNHGLSAITQTKSAATGASLSGLPTFSLPLRARLHQSSPTQQATLSSTASNHPLPPSLLDNRQGLPSNDFKTDTLSVRPTFSKPLVISKSLQTLLPALCSQQPHFVTAHIHRFPYLLQAGDTLRLPFYMKNVSAGDVLRLNRASILGSRDFTLKAGTSSTETYDRKRTGEPNYLDERLFEVRARVLGVDSGPMFTQEKTKRRNRKVKTVKSKHRYTILKIMEVKVKTLDELMKEKGTVLLES